MRRLFFAIAIPPEVGLSLSQLFSSKQFYGIRWIDKEQLHITVHFLGEVEDETAVRINALMPALCDTLSCFDLQFEMLEVLPKEKKPTIVWARFKDEPRFTGLSFSLQQIFSAAEARRPQPHITLARIRQLHQLPFDLPKVKPFSIPVNSVELWESHLHASGSKYEVIGKWKLKW